MEMQIVTTSLWRCEAGSVHILALLHQQPSQALDHNGPHERLLRREVSTAHAINTLHERIHDVFVTVDRVKK
jgi:hypothetical protein